jgi:integrase
VRLGDGNGLYLQVTPAGAKSWVLRYRSPVTGTVRDMGLGSADEVSVAEARRRAVEAKALVARGIDPLDRRSGEIASAKAEAAVPTFRALAERVIEQKAPGWRSSRQGRIWLDSLRLYAFPLLGEMPVNTIRTEHVLAVLTPIWTRIPETAQRVRQRMEAVLAAAAALGYRDRDSVNPALWKGHLAALLPAARAVRGVRHMPALRWEEAHDFYHALCEHDGMAALAARFCILTGARSRSVRLATWAEIDPAGRVWTSPGAHQKAGGLHRTPLADEAMRVLDHVVPLSRGQNSVIFPGARGGPLSDMALSMLIRRMAEPRNEGDPPRWAGDNGDPIVLHGFRSTLKEWCRAHGVPEHVSEMILAHRDPNRVRAAYARLDLLDQRRPVMEAWAHYLVTGKREA